MAFYRGFGDTLPLPADADAYGNCPAGKMLQIINGSLQCSAPPSPVAPPASAGQGGLIADLSPLSPGFHLTTELGTCPSGVMYVDENGARTCIKDTAGLDLPWAKAPVASAPMPMVEATPGVMATPWLLYFGLAAVAYLVIR